MNSIDLTPLYRSSIGFDRLASLIDSAFASQTSASEYPPYDIEALEDNRYSITLAVAGFTQEELDIQVEKGVLTVRGNKSSKGEGKFLYKGIVNRTFERKFNLADYIEVTGAQLTLGLLTISLVKEVPEAMKPKRIAIKPGSRVLEHQAEETADTGDHKAAWFKKDMSSPINCGNKLGGLMMDIEKLNPWNWFKHENQPGAQIPVAKSDVKKDSGGSLLATPHATDSLMQLHQEMDRLFDNVWNSFGLLSPRAGFMRPSSLLGQNLFDQSLMGDYRASLDVSGNEKEYEISIDLPGLSQNDIQLEVKGNVLTVSGEKEDTTENKDKQYYRVERSFGSFQRTLSLPEDANANDISATMKNGVLEIRVPRREIPKEDVKRISISS